MKFFSTFMEEKGLLHSPEAVGGFSLGVLVGAVFILLVVALIALRRQRKIQRDSIIVESDSGTLYITANAVREFVSRILSGYQAASLHGITLRQRSDRLLLRIDMDVLPETQVVPMVDDIRASVISQAAEKLGITLPIRVDVSLRSLSAKEGKIVRQQRRSGVPVRRGTSVAPNAEGDLKEQHLDLSEEEFPAEEESSLTAPPAGSNEDSGDGVPGPKSQDHDPTLPPSVLAEEKDAKDSKNKGKKGDNSDSDKRDE